MLDRSAIIELKPYINVLLWIAGGYVHVYLGVILVLITFFRLLSNFQKKEAIISMWLLFILSDSALPSLSFSIMIKPIVLLIMGFSVNFNRLNMLYDKKFIFSFIPFFIYTFIVSVFSTVPLGSVQKIVSYFLIYLVSSSFIFDIVQKEQIKEWAKSVVTLGMIVLLISIILGLFFKSIGAVVDNRFNGIFRNPNGLGVFCVFYSIICYTALSYYPDIISKNMKRWIILIVGVSIFASGSRNSYGALLIFIIGTKVAQFSPLIFSLLSVVVIFFFNGIYELVLQFIQGFDSNKILRLDTIDMASGRIYVWQAAWLEIINHNFYFGGGFDYAEGGGWLVKYYKDIPELIEHFGNIHQSFLTLWMNTGLAGVLLFVLGWSKQFVACYRKTFLTLPIVFTLIFLGSFESLLISSMNPFTIMYLCITCFLLYSDTKKLV